MALKEFAGAAPATRLSGSLAVGTTGSFTVITGGGAGYPSGSTAPFVVVIDRGTSLEEKILVTSRASDVFSTLTRGYDGTSAQAHSAQAVVEHVLDAATLTEVNAHVNTPARDDHTQYMNAARHAATPHTSAMIQDITIATADIADGAITYPKLAAGQRWEPGDFKWGFQTADHAGWLLMDGRNNLNRTTYAGLFGVVGTSMGAGDGSTTFGIADMTRRTPIGKAASGTASTLGGTGGSKDAVVISHSHTINDHTHSGTTGDHDRQHVHNVAGGGDHQHSYGADNANGAGGGAGLTPGGNNYTIGYNTALTGGAAHGHGNTDNANSGHLHAFTSGGASNRGTDTQGSAGTDLNLPPWIAMNAFIHT